MDPLESISDLKFESEKTTVIENLCGSEEEIADKKDNSRKGFYDVEISDMLTFLNSLPQYVSTSSCSGRAVLFSPGDSKNACKWHLVCHSEFTPQLLSDALRKISSDEETDVTLKFEPFILHVRCRSLGDAQVLHAIALQAGFRNSGITVRRKGKEGFAIHVAVRCTLHLEVPVFVSGCWMLSEEASERIGEVVAEKFGKNRVLIDRSA